MKFIIIACLIAVALADKDASVVKFESDVRADGYNYAYETSNGISADEAGNLKNAGSDNEAMDVAGQFEYTAPDGTVVKVTYVADENGFQPSGDHLPVAPPVPEYIERALKLLPVVEQRRRR